jgi:hypothetical protein
MLKIEDLYMGAIITHCYRPGGDIDSELYDSPEIIEHNYTLVGFDGPMLILESPEGIRKIMFNYIVDDYAIVGSEWHTELRKIIKHEEISKLSAIIEEYNDRIAKWNLVE